MLLYIANYVPVERQLKIGALNLSSIHKKSSEYNHGMPQPQIIP